MRIKGNFTSGIRGYFTIKTFVPFVWNTPAMLPSAYNSFDYAVPMSASFADGRPVTYAVTQGSLPAGISLVNGLLAGTPTSTVIRTFTITATDGKTSASKEFTLVVESGPQTPTVNSLLRVFQDSQPTKSAEFINPISIHAAHPGLFVGKEGRVSNVFIDRDFVRTNNSPLDAVRFEFDRPINIKFMRSDGSHSSSNPYATMHTEYFNGISWNRVASYTPVVNNKVFYGAGGVSRHWRIYTNSSPYMTQNYTYYFYFT